jgi:hypothetical protein
MRARVPLALAILLVAAVALAGAQDRQWISQSSPDGAEVMYGTPDSDDILFAVRCDAAAKEVFVGFAHQPIGVAPGGAIDLTVFSEAGEVVLAATVSYFDAADIYLIETGNVASDDLRKVLTQGRTLSVMVEDGAEEIPLEGSAEGFGKLFSACGL